MRCLGMLRGSVGNEGNATDLVEDLIAPKDSKKESFLDRIMSARTQEAPISTGVPAMDLDMEGGVRPAGVAVVALHLGSPYLLQNHPASARENPPVPGRLISAELDWALSRSTAVVRRKPATPTG